MKRGICVVCLCVVTCCLFAQNVWKDQVLVEPRVPVQGLQETLGKWESVEIAAVRIEELYGYMRDMTDGLQKSQDVSWGMGTKGDVEFVQGLASYGNRLRYYMQELRKVVREKDIKMESGTYALSDIRKFEEFLAVHAVYNDGVDFLVREFWMFEHNRAKRGTFTQKYRLLYGHMVEDRFVKDVALEKGKAIAIVMRILGKGVAEDEETIRNYRVTDTKKVEYLNKQLEHLGMIRRYMRSIWKSLEVLGIDA